MPKVMKYSNGFMLSHETANNPEHCLGAISRFTGEHSRKAFRDFRGKRPLKIELKSMTCIGEKYGVQFTFEWWVTVDDDVTHTED